MATRIHGKFARYATPSATPCDRAEVIGKEASFVLESSNSGVATISRLGSLQIGPCSFAPRGVDKRYV